MFKVGSTNLVYFASSTHEAIKEALRAIYPNPEIYTKEPIKSKVSASYPQTYSVDPSKIFKPMQLPIITEWNDSNDCCTVKILVEAS